MSRQPKAEESQGTEPAEEQELYNHHADGSRNVESGLELLDKGPFFHGYIRAVELLQCVDTCTRDVRVQCVGLF